MSRPVTGLVVVSLREVAVQSTIVKSALPIVNRMPSNSCYQFSLAVIFKHHIQYQYRLLRFNFDLTLGPLAPAISAAAAVGVLLDLDQH